MSDPVICVENLSKRYVISHRNGKGDGLRHAIENAVRAPFGWLRKAAGAKGANGNGRPDLPISGVRTPKSEEFWALKDVNLEVKQGEVVGIIGRNGAGKSTLLKILSRITEPTSGRIALKGRVASLLEVGTGFHPELTGRENVFLNGAILGMARAEIKRKFDEIVAFAGIERFLDTPVKRYSSGMYVRLAFAVAAYLEPEILVVDEVLAVGDAEFQKKCMARMHDISHSHGRTILFVSHNMAAVQNLCSRGILLHEGRVRLTDTPERVIRHYIDTVTNTDVKGSLLTAKNRSGNGLVKITGFHIEDGGGLPMRCAISGKDLVFVFTYETAPGARPRKVDVGFSIASSADQLLFVHYSSYSGIYLDPPSARGYFRCGVKKLPISAGRYLVGARIVVDQEEADWPKDGIGHLEVETGDFYGTGSTGFAGAAPFLVEADWKVVASRENTLPFE